MNIINIHIGTEGAALTSLPIEKLHKNVTYSKKKPRGSSSTSSPIREGRHQSFCHHWVFKTKCWGSFRWVGPQKLLAISGGGGG